MKFTKEHIVESIKSGKDREVLCAMYRDIYPKIERYVMGNAGSKDDSKDVFQEAILVFYNNVISGNYNRINEITGYIINVSRNIWINKVRKTKNEVEGSHLENYEDHTPSPLISIIMDEKWAAYQNLFDNIGSRCKELLNYSVYEKLSMREIALKMNFSSENSAKTQNYRCKQKLMDLVSENKELEDLLKS